MVDVLVVGDGKRLSERFSGGGVGCRYVFLYAVLVVGVGAGHFVGRGEVPSVHHLACEVVGGDKRHHACLLALGCVCAGLQSRAVHVDVSWPHGIARLVGKFACRAEAARNRHLSLHTVERSILEHVDLRVGGDVEYSQTHEVVQVSDDTSDSEFCLCREALVVVGDFRVADYDVA